MRIYFDICEIIIGRVTGEGAGEILDGVLLYRLTHSRPLLEREFNWCVFFW